MNAASMFLDVLPRTSLIAVLPADIPDDATLYKQESRVIRRFLRVHYLFRLVELLNRLRAEDLRRLAEAFKVNADGVGALRLELWRFAARFERMGRDVPAHLQPAPVLLKKRLVFLRPGPGLMPPSDSMPRPIPDEREPCFWPDPPGDSDELAARAQRLVGVRLSNDKINKGAFGNIVAEMLGLCEDNAAEADFAGDVEVKTVPVCQSEQGLWYVKEDPAISMDTVAPLHKLRRVLWLARYQADDYSTVLSWFLQSLDDSRSRMANRYLHLRPKGRKGTNRSGWYLKKDYFAENGFLWSLNGSANNK